MVAKEDDAPKRQSPSVLEAWLFSLRRLAGQLRLGRIFNALSVSICICILQRLLRAYVLSLRFPKFSTALWKRLMTMVGVRGDCCLLAEPVRGWEQERNPGRVLGI